MNMKDEDIWNKILLVVQVGDQVRFKRGRTVWKVILTGHGKNGHFILIKRSITHHVNHTTRWNVPWYEYVQEIVQQGTQEYRNLRIVRPSQ